MSYEDDHQRQVRIGQAINLAWQYALLSGSVTNPEDVAALTQEVVPITLSLIEAVQDGAVNTVAEVTAVQQVMQAFPGAEIIPIRPPQSQPPPTPQPAPVPGASSGRDDALWQEYFQDPTAWWDNRDSKRSPAAADFAHKVKRNDKGYPLGLWLNGKFGSAPQWVLDRLAGAS